MFNRVNLSSGDIKYFWSKKEMFSDNDIEALKNAYLTSPEWTAETTLLATFNETLSAGGYNNDFTINSYNIYRKKVGEEIIREVALGVQKNGILDFNVQSNEEYIYYVVPIFELKDGSLKLGEMAESNSVRAQNNSWSIVGLRIVDSTGRYEVDEDNIWRLALDIQADQFKLNDKKSIHEGLNRFPHISDTELDYLTIPVEVGLGDVSCGDREYSDDNFDKLEQWRKFCKNGELKLLKDIYGHVIPCEIHDCSYTQSSEPSAPSKYITKIKFEAIQLKDANDISAYMEQDFS